MSVRFNLESSVDIPGQHDVLLVSEDMFDALITKIRERGIQRTVPYGGW